MERRILYILESLFDGLVVGPEDRDCRDTVQRLFTEAHGENRPPLAELYPSAYAVEIECDNPDDKIAEFVKLIEQNQIPSAHWEDFFIWDL